MRYALIVTIALAALLATTAATAAEKDEPLTVEKNDKLLEDGWTMAFRLSDAFVGKKSARKKNRKADVLIWLPEGVEKLRALAIVPNNTDSKNFHMYKPYRKVLAKHQAGVVYLRHFWTGIEYHHKKPVSTPPAAKNRTTTLLKLLAEETGIEEFEHAPWMTFGKSSRGEFPFRMGWIFPDRTLASISYHAETPSWPIPDWAAEQDQTILHVNANGEDEWSGTWYRHVRPSLLNYRARTPWLPHQVVAHGVGHGTYADMHGSKGWGKPVPEGKMSVLRIWDYLSLFTDKAMTLRLPEKGYPTDGPLTLRQVDPTTGYLIHPRAVEELLDTKWFALRYKEGAYHNVPWPDEKHPVWDAEQGEVKPDKLIRKATDVTEDQRGKYFWVPDRETVTAWLELHNIKSAKVTVPK